MSKQKKILLSVGAIILSILGIYLIYNKIRINNLNKKITPIDDAMNIIETVQENNIETIDTVEEDPTPTLPPYTDNNSDDIEFDSSEIPDGY